jgi:hypothetical protein
MIAFSRRSWSKLAACYAPFARSIIPSRANGALLPLPGAALDTGTMHRISGLHSRTEITRASHVPRETGVWTMAPIGFDGQLAKPEGTTVYMRERLGSQLFNCAAGLAQARRFGTPCHASLAFYRCTWPRRTYSKSCDLGLFDSDVVIPDVRSLSHVRRLGLDGPVYVASDSLDAVLQEFSGIADLVPIATLLGVAPLEVMLLLSRADGLVAGSKTLRRWVGFIGDRTDHVVVAARPWFTSSDFDSRDLLPRSWLTLDRAKED